MGTTRGKTLLQSAIASIAKQSPNLQLGDCFVVALLAMTGMQKNCPGPPFRKLSFVAVNPKASEKLDVRTRAEGAWVGAHGCAPGMDFVPRLDCSGRDMGRRVRIQEGPSRNR
jgi:hypothetical protein